MSIWICFFFLRVGSPPLPDFTQLDRKIIRIIEQVVLAHLLKNQTHIVWKILFHRMGVDLCDPPRINGTCIDRHKTVPKTKKLVCQKIDRFLSRFSVIGVSFLTIPRSINVLRYFATTEFSSPTFVVISFRREAPLQLP